MRLSFPIVLLCLGAAFAASAAPKNATDATPREPAKYSAAAGRGATVEIGDRDGVDFRIDIPPNWNRDLVVFFHGYAVEPVAFHDGEPLSPMFAPILAGGYAIAQSAYSATGWAVEQGSADSEALRRYFVSKYGAPRRTWAVGMSMGGLLTVMALETQPRTYAGGLSLCGAIEPADRFLQRAFALRAAFDYYFPDLLGPAVPVPADFVPNRDVVARIASALEAKPKAAAVLLRLYHGDARSLADVLAFVTYQMKELQRRTRGNPFGNADLVYTGSGDDDALNDGVRRYRADASAAAYLARWYAPSGRLQKPLLALHDTRDPLVPASGAFEYALLAQRAGQADRFVQQYVAAEGHCVFTPPQIGSAFDALVGWAQGGARPASGRQP
ncbi:MAG TPA: alpha/beta hydrolase [Dokdonella sp.]